MKNRLLVAIVLFLMAASTFVFGVFSLSNAKNIDSQGSIAFSSYKARRFDDGLENYVYYTSIQAAVDSASNGETIEVIRSHSINESVMVANKQINISATDGLEIVLTRTSSYTGSLFTVSTGADLTLGTNSGLGTLELDGENRQLVATGEALVKSLSSLAIKNGVEIKNNFPYNKALAVHVESGYFNMTGGLIENNKSNGYANSAAVYLEASAQAYFEGGIINIPTTLNAEVAVYASASAEVVFEAGDINSQTGSKSVVLAGNSGSQVFAEFKGTAQIEGIDATYADLYINDTVSITKDINVKEGSVVSVSGGTVTSDIIMEETEVYSEISIGGGSLNNVYLNETNVMYLWGSPSIQSVVLGEGNFVYVEEAITNSSPIPILPYEYTVGTKVAEFLGTFTIDANKFSLINGVTNNAEIFVLERDLIIGTTEELQISINPSSYTYNATQRTPSVSIVVGGQPLTLTTHYTLSGDLSGTNAQTYTINVTGAGIYSNKSGSAEWVINPDSAALIITLNNTEFTYTGSVITPVITQVATSQRTLSASDYDIDGTSELSATNVGTFTISVTGKGNYSGTGSIEWQITPMALVSVTFTNVIYNGSAQVPAVATITPSAATYQLKPTSYSQTNAETYTVTIEGTGNYSGEVSANWTIAQKEITGNWNPSGAAIYTYNGSLQGPDFTGWTGVIASDTSNIGQDVLNNKEINAGSYTATASLTGTKADNYIVVGGSSKAFTIDPRGLDSVTFTTVTYNGTQQVPSVASVSPVGATYQLKPTSYTQKNAGSYTVTIEGTGNYAGEVSGNWTINPIGVQIQWGSTSLTYTGLAQAPSATIYNAGSVIVSGDVVSVSVSGHKVEVGGPTGYVATATLVGADASNYQITSNQTTTFTIGQKGISIDWTNTSLTYNANVQSPTATIRNIGTAIVSGDIVSVTVSGGQTTHGTYTATAVLVGDDASQYIIIENETTQFTISKKNVAISWTPSGQATWEYDGSAHGPSYNQTGLVQSDIDNSRVAVNVADATAVDVGTYTATLSLTGTRADNYTLTNNTKEYTISAKVITFVVELSAYSYTYDKTAKTPTITVKDGTTTLTTASYNTPTGTLSATNAGNYTINVTGKGNYAGSTGTANWSISKAALTITADNKSSAYLENIAALTYAISGTIYSGDNASVVSTLTLSTTATNSSPVGTYPITLTTSGHANYEITTVNGTYTITPRITTFTVELTPNTFVYNNAVRTPTITVKDGETVLTTASYNTPTGTTSATDFGTYTINISGKDNYAGSSGSAQWNITKAGLTVNWTNTDLTYNATVQAPSASLTGVFVGDTVGVAVSGGQTFVGSYTATATLNGADAGNYEITANPTSPFTISAAEVTMSWSSTTSFAYDGTAKTLTYTYDGFIASDVSGSLVSLGVTDNVRTAVGNYTATASLSGTRANQYTITNPTQAWNIYAPTITVTLNSQGGTGATTGNWVWGSGNYVNSTLSANGSNTLGTLPSTSRTGYTFNGWYTLASGGSQISSSTIVPVTNTTYHAQWTANRYAVTFNPNTGTLSGTSPLYAQYDTTVMYTLASGGVAGTLPTASKAVTGYTVTYNGWYTATSGGTQVITAAGVVNASVAGITNASKQYIMTGAVTLYAQFTETANTYTVTYNSNKPVAASASVTGSTANSNHTYNVAQNLTSNGYAITGWTFANWNTAANGSGTSYTNSQSVTNLASTNGATVTLYAQWTENTYQIRFNKNHASATGTMSNQSFTYEESKALTANAFSYTGRTFGSWNTVAGGTGTTYTNGQTVTKLTATNSAIIDLYAQWNTNTYTVTYNSNKPAAASANISGTTANSSHTYDVAANLTTNGYTLTGWTFTNWNTVANGSGTTYTNSQSVTNLTTTPGATVTLYAQWTAVAYTVSYNSNKPAAASANISGTTANSNHTYDTEANLTANGYTLTGWTFTNWNTAANGSGTTYTNSQSVSNLRTTAGTFTLYAQWTENTYSVRFNKNHASATGTMSNQSFTYEESKALTANAFAYTGRTFASWNTIAGGTGTTYLNGVTVTKLSATNGAVIDLYAQWTVNGYTVEYNSNKPAGASATMAGTTASSSHTYDVAQNLTSNGYTLTGWTFENWNTVANGSGTTYTNGQSVSNLTTTNGATVILYAQWSANTYTVTYNSNKPAAATATMAGTTANSNHTYDIAGNLTSNGYTLTGWTFANWNTAANGSGTTYTNGQSVSNLRTTAGTFTLYAQWTANRYAVTFNPNTGTLSGTSPLYAQYDTTVMYTLASGGVAGTLPTASKSVTGYTVTYNGWYTATSGGTQVITAAGVVNASVAGITNASKQYIMTGAVTLYAQFTQTAIDYTITVAPNGGTGGSVSPSTYNISGSSQTRTLTLPTRTGYSISSWTVTGHTGSIPTISSATLTIPASTYGNLTLTTNWTANTYTLTLNANSGTISANANWTGSGASATKTVTYNSVIGTIPTSSEISRTGYTFAGWLISATPITSATVWAYTSNQTAIAQWNQNSTDITFDKEGGTGGSNTVTAYFDSAMPAATAPTRTGYVFDGYYDGDNGTGTQYYTAAMASARNWDKDVATATLHAKWNIIAYTITVNANGGTGGSVSPSTYNISGSSQTRTITNPTNIGYYISSWTVIGHTGTVPTVSGTTLTIPANTYGSLTLTANWTAITYTITYNSNKPVAATGTVTGSTANSAHTYDTPKALTSNGYLLDGWSFTNWTTVANGTGTSFTNGQSVNNLTSVNLSTITLYAQWSQVTYTVTYNSNKPAAATATMSGTTANSNHTYDVAANLTTNGYSLTGWTFASWNTAANGSGTSYTNGQAVTNLTTTNGATVTLYAQWTANRYAVTFNPNTGTLSGTSPLYAQYDTTVMYTLSSGGVAGTIPTASKSVTGYTVTYNGWYTATSGGTQVITAAGVVNASVAGITNASKQYIMTGAVTLYAQFSQSAISYTITVAPNGGTGGSASPSTYNISGSSQTSTITHPTRAGWTLNGYTVTGHTGTIPTVSGATLTIPASTYGNLVLTANWDANSYTITVAPNGGTGGSVSASTYSTSTSSQTRTVTHPTRGGWTLNGYTITGHTGSIPTVSGTTLTIPANTYGNLTLTAIWTGITTNTITVAPNGGTGGSVTPTTYTTSASSQTATLTHPTRTGYTLNGYTVTGHSGSIPTVSGTTLTIPANTYGNLVLTANWDAISYSITVAPNGGTGGSVTASTYNISGSSQTRTVTHPTRTGYTVSSYTVTGHTGTIPTVSGTTLTIPASTYGNLTLTANWSANTYTVAYNSNKPAAALENVTGTTASSNHTYDSAQNLTANGYSLLGYTFTGWNTAANGSGTAYDNQESVINLRTTAGTFTLYAQWSVNSYMFDINTYLNGTSRAGSYTVFTFTVDVNSVTAATGVSDFYQSVAYGSIVEIYNITAISGSTYSSYTISSNGEEQSGSDSSHIIVQTIAEGQTNVNLYATSVNYSISYTLNGGTAGASAPTSYDFEVINQTLTVSNPTRTAHTFLNWSISGYTGTAPSFSGTTLTIPGKTYGNLTLTANWSAISYTITVAPNGGTGGSASPSTYNISGSSQTSTITHPTRTGYTLNGYTVTGHTGSTPTVSGATLTIPANTYGNLTVTANWTAVSYSITVAPNGGTGGSASPSTYNISGSSQTSTITHPTRGGWTLNGYTVTGQTGTIPTVSGATLTIPANTYGNLTLTAIWEGISYSITVAPNGGTGGSVTPTTYTTSASSQTATLTHPTRTGYTLNGYTVTGHTGSTPTVSGTTLTIPANTYGNLTVTANWTAVSYTITVAPNGGTGGSASPSTYNISDSSQTSTITHPTRTGYTLNGYTVTGHTGSTPTVSGATLTIPANTYGNLTLTANWTAVSYSITIAPNGGTGGSASPSTYNISGSSQTSTITHPTRGGWTLNGYTVTGHTGTTPTVSGATLTIPAGTYGNLTLTANWTGITTNTITVAPNGGTGGSVTPTTYTTSASSQTATLTHPTRTGYTLTGYTVTGHSGTIPTVSGTTLTIPANTYGNLTVTANWTAVSYTITVAPNGGTGGSASPSSYNISGSSQTSTITHPTRTGYTLNGYTVTGHTGTTPTVSGTTLTIPANTYGNLTLTPQWTAVSYSITVAPNGGTGGSASPSTYNISGSSQTSTITHPTRGGWTLNGYTVTGHTGTTPTVSGATLTIPAGTYGNLTLTANWTANTYNIGVEPNGGTGGSVTASTYSTSTSSQTRTITHPTRTGYTLNGYTVTGHTGSIPTVSGTTLTIPANTYGDLTLTANWDAITYSITVAPNGGTGGSASPSSYNISGSSQTSTITHPTRTGYTLNGYVVTGHTGTIPTVSGATLTIPANTYGNLTLTAQWTAVNYTTTITVTMNATTLTTVTVDLPGATVTPQNRTTSGTLSFTIPFGTNLTPTAQFAAQSGKTYNLAWGSRGSSATTAATNVNGTNFTKGTTTETYTVVLTEMYTITYNGNDHTSGTVPTAGTKFHGETYTVVANSLTRTNYDATGWNTAANGSGTDYADSSSYTSNSAVTLYAKWLGSYYNTTITVTMNATTLTTVTVNLPGATNTPQNRATSGTLTFSIRFGTSVTPTTQFAAQSGKTYNLAWGARGATATTAATNVNGTSFTKGSSVESYTVVLTEMYIITYNGNSNDGGTVPTAGSKFHAESFTIATNSLTRANFVADGWNTNSSGTGTNYANGASYTTNAALTIYSKWIAASTFDVYNQNKFIGYNGGTTALTNAIAGADAGNTLAIYQHITITSQISIAKNLTIIGGAARSLTRDAAYTGNMFSITAGNVNFGTSGSTLTINGNNVANVNSVINSTTTGTITFGSSFAVTNNKNYVGEAYVTGNHGGVIRMSTGNLVINGGSYTGNQAADGGVIYMSNGTATISGGTFSSNSAVASQLDDGGSLKSGYGAVVAINLGTLTITSGTFSANNSARQDIDVSTFTYRDFGSSIASLSVSNVPTINISGGANILGTIYLSNDSISIAVPATANWTTAIPVYLHSTSYTAERTVATFTAGAQIGKFVSGNPETFFNFSSNNLKVATIARINSTNYSSLRAAFSSAASSGDTILLVENTGLGYQISTSKNVTLIASGAARTITRNLTNTVSMFNILSGGVLNFGTTSNFKLTIDGNKAAFGSTRSGALVNINSGGTAYLKSNIELTNNRSDAYGAAVLNEGTLGFDNDTLIAITNNESNNYSSGIYNFGTIVNGYIGYLNEGDTGTFTVSGNIATRTLGSSAIMNQFSGTYYIKGGTFSNNAGNYGAVVSSYSGTLNITGGTFESNTANFAGVVYIGAGTLNISGGTFTGNNQSSGNATVIGTYSNQVVNISGGTFNSQTARTVPMIDAYLLYTANLYISGGSFNNAPGAAIRRIGTTYISGNPTFSGNAIDISQDVTTRLYVNGSMTNSTPIKLESGVGIWGIAVERTNAAYTFTPNKFVSTDSTITLIQDGNYLRKGVEVTWSGSPGSPASQTTTYYASGTLGTLPTVTRNGYTYGWYTASSGGTQITTGTSRPTVNTTYYAQYSFINYSITVAPNGGTGGSSSPATYNISGSSQTRTITHPTRNGYTFNGYSVSGHTGSIPTVSGTTLTIPASTYGNLTLTAQWTIITYNITVAANGGTGGSVSASTYTIGGSIQTRTVTHPTRTGYTLTSYTITGHSGDIPTVLGSTLSIPIGTYGHLTLTANWTIITYNITVAPNGGTGGSSSPATYTISGSSQTRTITHPTRVDYALTSYTITGHTGSIPTISGTTLTIPANTIGSLTLTANWSAAAFRIGTTYYTSSQLSSAISSAPNDSTIVFVATTTYNPSTIIIDKTLTFRAEDSRTVTFDATSTNIFSLVGGTLNLRGPSNGVGLLSFNYYEMLPDPGQSIIYLNYGTINIYDGFSFGKLNALGNYSAQGNGDYYYINDYRVTVALTSSSLPYNGSSQSIPYTVKHGANTIPASYYVFSGNTGTNTGSYVLQVDFKEASTYFGEYTLNWSITSVTNIRVDLDITGGSPGTANGWTYSTTYYKTGLTANGTNTIGTMPIVSKTGYTFVKWNTQTNGLGTDINSSTKVPASNATYYAIWILDVARVGSTRYPSLQSAVTAASSGSTIYVLIPEVTVSTAIGVAKNLTIMPEAGVNVVISQGDETDNHIFVVEWEGNTLTLSGNGANTLTLRGETRYMDPYNNYYHGPLLGIMNQDILTPSYIILNNGVYLAPYTHSSNLPVISDINGTSGILVDNRGTVSVAATTYNGSTQNLGTVTFTHGSDSFTTYMTYSGVTSTANAGNHTYFANFTANTQYPYFGSRMGTWVINSVSGIRVDLDLNGGSPGTANGWTYSTTYYKTGLTANGTNTLGTMPTVSRSEFTFVGWNTQANGGGTTINSSTKVPPSNTTYYAIWTFNNWLRVGSTEYNTWSAAYGAVGTGGTVYITRNVTLYDTMGIDKSLTLQPYNSSVTVTRATTLTAAMISVGRSNFTIGNSSYRLTLDGNRTNVTALASILHIEWVDAQLFGTFTTTLGDNLTLRNNNNNGGSGGAILNEGTIINSQLMYGIIIDNNRANGSGGAISNGSITIGGEAFQITNNTAVNGGAIYTNNSMIIGEVYFANNSASVSGGAIYVDGGTLTISNYYSQFTGNTASTTSGGGAILASGATTSVNISNGTFTSNGSTTNTYGGAIRILNSASLTISGGTFTSNQAQYGGAIYGTSNGSVTITGGTFSNNNASQYGGALRIGTGTSLNITGGSFSGNTATVGARAIYNSSTTFTMSGNPSFGSNDIILISSSTYYIRVNGNMSNASPIRIDSSSGFGTTMVAETNSAYNLSTSHFTEVSGATYAVVATGATVSLVKGSKISWSGNGGSPSSTDTFYPGTGTLGSNMPSNPTRNYYIFSSWNTMSNGSGTTITSGSAVPTSNVTYYAIWTAGAAFNLSTSTTYTSLVSAISAASSGNTIILTQNQTLSSTLTFPTSLTIYANGNYTVTMNSNYLMLTSSYTINIGSASNPGGTISFVGSNTSYGFYKGTGTLNMLNYSSIQASSATYGIYNAAGTLTISGGSISAATRGIHHATTTTLNVSGGYVYGNSAGIYNASTGTVNVSGSAYIYSGDSGIYNNSTGTIVVGGEIEGDSYGIYNVSTGQIQVGTSGTIYGGYYSIYLARNVETTSYLVTITGSAYIGAAIYLNRPSENYANIQVLSTLSNYLYIRFGTAQYYMLGDGKTVRVAYRSSTGYSANIMVQDVYGDFYGSAYDSNAYWSGNYFLAYGGCFSADSWITVWDRKRRRLMKKKAKEITYDDLLLVWNFDKGCYDYAKPLTIQRESKMSSYTEISFSDGTKLEIAKEHVVFNLDKNMFTPVVSNNPEMGCPIGTRVINEKGEIVTIVGKKQIKEEIIYTNIFTNYHLNVYVNGILTSTQHNNLYPIKDMKFVKDGRQCQNLTLLDGISQEWIDGMRLYETTDEELMDTPRYFEGCHVYADYINLKKSVEKPRDEK